MRLAPFALLSLLLTVSAARVALAAKAPLTGTALPGATVTFTTDPFGYLLCDPDELTATDPADKTKTLPPARWCSGQILSIHELGTTPPQSVGLGDASELPLTKSFIDATNLKLYDPAQDVVTGSTRKSVFHVATQGALSVLVVTLSQTVQGPQLVQVYTLKNPGSVPLSLRVDGVVDGDVDTGLGSNQNYGVHDARWAGAALPGAASASATISDSTRLIGVTLALQGGAPEGYRLLRAAAPGYEIYRVPALGGYHDPAFLNGLFTFPAAAFGNGVYRPFTDEIPDDVNGDGISDAPGDIVIGLQTTLTLLPGTQQDVTLTTTLASGGPYLDASICPLASVKVNEAVDVTLSATSVFGEPTYSISSGALPPGLSIVNGHLVGKPTVAGAATFDLTVTDERLRKDTVACSIKVTGCAVDCAAPVACQAAGSCDESTNTCTYQALPDGSACGGTGQCLAGACEGGESGSAGSAGTAGTTGSAGTGSAGTASGGAGSAATGAGGATTSGPGGNGATGSGGAGNGAYTSAGGCGCGVAGGAGRGAGWALVGLALLAAARRRRARCADHDCW